MYILILTAFVTYSAHGSYGGYAHYIDDTAHPVIIKAEFETFEQCERAREHQTLSLTQSKLRVTSQGCYRIKND